MNRDFDYEYELLCFKVDTMNERVVKGKIMPIDYILDQECVPKKKRIKMLNDMIIYLSNEIYSQQKRA